MACDLCGRTGTQLEDLLDAYKTAEIKAVCAECAKVANKLVRKIRNWQDGILTGSVKQAMTMLREQHAPGPALRTSANVNDTLQLRARDVLQLLFRGRLRIGNTPLRVQLWRRFP